MHYTYILQSIASKKLYIGTTDDLKTRFAAHNAGKVRSTKTYKPWMFLYYEAHRNKTLARRAEIFYKSSQGRRQLKKKLDLS